MRTFLFLVLLLGFQVGGFISLSRALETKPGMVDSNKKVLTLKKITRRTASVSEAGVAPKGQGEVMLSDLTRAGSPFEEVRSVPVSWVGACRNIRGAVYVSSQDRRGYEDCLDGKPVSSYERAGGAAIQIRPDH